MGMDLRPLGVGGIKPNIGVAPKYGVNFGSSDYQDTVSFTTPERFLNETAIKKLVTSNPKLQKMVKEINPEIKLNLEELKELAEKHASDTQNIAKGIIDNLSPALKNKVNTKAVNDAAKLHDIGKVFIPLEILNKPSKLTDKEMQIMHKHSELGYELLKNSDIDTQTLHLVRYHHQNALKNGYPKADSSFSADINQQVLSVADKYSALLEKRPYKTEMSPKQALNIIYKDMQEGKISPFVFKALVEYAKTTEPQKITA